jgi:phage-related holin
VENAALLGVPFPKGLLEALERFRDSQEEDVKPG